MSITSRELMTKLEIKNVKTLTRWYQQQVIPVPIVELHPGGIGRIACWPDWVLKHGRIIKKLLGEGHTLKDVAATFGTNWPAIAARYPKYNFKIVSEKMDREKILWDICESIYSTVATHLGNIRSRLEAVAFPPVTYSVIKQALDLIEKGHNPVLILSSEKTVVVPDFLLSLHLAKHYGNSDPFLVVPLFSIVAQSHAGTKLAKKPTTQPVSMVTRGKDGSEPTSVMLGTDWEFLVEGDP